MGTFEASKEIYQDAQDKLDAETRQKDPLHTVPRFQIYP